VTELDIERTYEPDDGRIRRLLDLVTGRNRPKPQSATIVLALWEVATRMPAKRKTTEPRVQVPIRMPASLKAALEENHKVRQRALGTIGWSFNDEGRALTDSGPRAGEDDRHDHRRMKPGVRKND